MIRKVIQKYGEENFYISFSGGKDSTIVHHLVDIALPDNQIPRVFINTGIEYLDMVKHVKQLAENDERIVIYNSGVHITKMLKKYGYPFKSKIHARKVATYQNSGYCKTARMYIEGIRSNKEKSSIKCPKKLAYQFTEENKLKISDHCCYKLKKEPAKRYQKQSGKNIPIIGLRMAEGGTRRYRKSCTSTRCSRRRRRNRPADKTGCPPRWPPRRCPQGTVPASCIPGTSAPRPG